MPAYINIIDSASNNAAAVDDNKQLAVALNPDPAKAGAVRLYDAGGNPIAVEENGALSVSQDELILSEQVDGSALNTNKWTTSVSTFTVTQGNGFIALNGGASLATGSYAILNSIMNVPLYGDMPVEFAFSAKPGIVPIANATMELGIGAASGTSSPTDGAFFRWNPNGQFQAVVSYGGSETTANIAAAPTVNVKSLFFVIISEDHVQFLVNDALVADIANPPGGAFPVSAGHQPVYARVYTAGSAPSSAPTLSIGQVMVRQIAVNLARPWRDAMAAMGMGAYQSPLTPFAQSANHANSASPSSATLSNTAAGYTTLGGRFQFAAPSAAATDFALFAYQVPSPFKFYCTGVAISSVVSGVAIVTPTLLDWALGINASAASLATLDGAGTWAPRRIPLGLQGGVALAAVGAMFNDIVRLFDPPLVIDSNRYLHVILQVPAGAATASLVFRGDVLLTGYFE